MKQGSYSNLHNPSGSRTDIQKQTETQQPRTLVDDSMLLSRPGKDNSNIMVIQAYKKTMITCNAPPIPQNGGVKKQISKKEVKVKSKFQGGSNNRLVDLDEGIIIPLGSQINSRPSMTAVSTSNAGGKKSASSSFYQSNFSSEVSVGQNQQNPIIVDPNTKLMII